MDSHNFYFGCLPLDSPYITRRTTLVLSFLCLTISGVLLLALGPRSKGNATRPLATLVPSNSKSVKPLTYILIAYPSTLTRPSTRVIPWPHTQPLELVNVWTTNRPMSVVSYHTASALLAHTIRRMNPLLGIINPIQDLSYIICLTVMRVFRESISTRSMRPIQLR